MGRQTADCFEYRKFDRGRVGTERRLLDEFRRVLEWDAILLFDEADVVLETRSFEDVRRNGIVSGTLSSMFNESRSRACSFLSPARILQGVLFLMTNRISTMDIAFQSRIQVAIECEELKPKARAMVWRGLLERRQKTIDAKSFENILENINVLADVKLNGREIRNVLNGAEGPAFNEYAHTGQMQYSHIQKAVKAAWDFHKFFDNARLKARTIRVSGFQGIMGVTWIRKVVVARLATLHVLNVYSIRRGSLRFFTWKRLFQTF